MVDQRRGRQDRYTTSHPSIHAEVEQLLKVLRVRSNRDKLDDRQFLLAGSLLERWKWNSRTITGNDLGDFRQTVRELVIQIKANERNTNRSSINE